MAVVNGKHHESKLCKVKCRSKEQFKQIEEIIFDTFCDVIDKASDLTDDQRIASKSKFKSEFAGAFSANIEFTNSLTYNEEESRSKKEHYLNELLLPKLDKMIVETTRKRKMYPKDISSNFCKRLKLDRDYLDNLEVKLPARPVSEQIPLIPDLNDKIIESFTNVVETTTRVKKNYVNSIKKLEDFKQIKSMLKNTDDFLVKNCSALFKGDAIHTVENARIKKTKLLSSFKTAIGSNFNIFDNYKKC